MKLKKPIKIILGVIIFITLPTLLLFGFAYFKYHEPLPIGTKGAKADNLATKMLIALNYEAYRNTDYIEWTFKNKRHYNWEKAKHKCDVLWKEYKVKLDFNDHSKSKAYVHGFTISGEKGKELVDQALDYFENDIFWLIAPYQVFDEGVTREFVTLPSSQKGLLVNYSENETYLWKIDSSGLPTSFQMWGNKTPIDGLEATWNDWTFVATGAKFPTFHKLLFFGFELTDLEATAPKDPKS
ncbi:hypothetical protein MHTCC0001_27720 [Flavobacteriaceae bacterium MHTCC 0001]